MKSRMGKRREEPPYIKKKGIMENKDFIVFKLSLTSLLKRMLPLNNQIHWY